MHLTGIVALASVTAGCLGAEQNPASGEPTVDASGMLAHLAFLASDSLEGRATGSEGNRIAREYIAQAFDDIGLGRFEGSWVQVFAFERDDVGYNGANVVGFVEGTASRDSFIVVTAHYDHVGIRDGEVYNGADDNASGTAALLALSAYFVEHPPGHSIIFAALDAEEVGHHGAKALVADPPVPSGGIVLNINMDMVSHSDSVLYVAGTYHYPELKPYVERVRDGARVSLPFGHDSPDLPQDWTTSSDHSAFHEVGIPFLYFGVEDHPDYHRPTDDVGRINQEFYVAAVEAILDVLLEIDGGLGSP
jgi:Zn-dependent M28 family amino/carboxypeptidase